MTTYINLQFNDGEINLSTSSFLFKQSKLFQSIDIDEDNTIPILCSRSYIIDNNKICLFDDKTDLSFMFTLLPNKFLEVCKFLDIICYENIDILFSKQFITYVIDNIKEEINVIKYFMQPEIRSIMNYLNNECIDLQIKSCTPTFYALYLSEYKEDVIKHNRIDIYELSSNKRIFYRYIHKYDNNVTYFVKETHEYNDYVTDISNLLRKSNLLSIFNKIKESIEQGNDINTLTSSSKYYFHQSRIGNNLEITQYLVENGANVNLPNSLGCTSLHVASYQSNNFEVIKYLVEHGANVNLKSNNGYTALCFASLIYKNEKVINYLKHMMT